MGDKNISDLLEMLFRQAQTQFGSAIKARWLYDADGCPGCGREIDATKIKGKDALSLNAFIYREHGVLIAYLLCGKCGKKVIRAKFQTDLHREIENNLKQRYLLKQGH
jgi:hypothetical protein